MSKMFYNNLETKYSFKDGDYSRPNLIVNGHLTHFQKNLLFETFLKTKRGLTIVLPLYFLAF